MICVFDLDGTLIDSSKRHYLLMSELLQLKGITIPYAFEQDFMSFKADGNSGLRYLTEKLKIDFDTAQNVNNLWIDNIENEKWLIYDELFDDSILTCDYFSNKNDRIIYLSSRHSKENTYTEVARLGIDRYADDIIIVNGTNPKDDKCNFLKGLNTQSDIIMIGDTEVDYNAAQEACVSYYILNRGFRSRSYWERHNVESYSNFQSLLKNL